MKKMCTATAKSGERCKRSPIAGGTVCRVHGGASPRVKALAAVRAELERWGINDAVDDPGETLLRLLAQSRRRVEMLSAELETKASELGLTLEQVTVGEVVVLDDLGIEHKTGEYIRGLVRAEAEERDRCARFAQIALAAKLMEQRADLAERHGGMIGQLLETALGDPAVSLTLEQRVTLVAALRRALEDHR